ncbi:MAG: hypothetical protein ACREXS_08510 [Gammaproteobacteria bacterium]
METFRSSNLLCIILIFLMQGCALRQILDVATEEDLSHIEKSRVYPKNYDAVWAATVKSLAMHGVSIQSQDKTSSNISTDWMVEREAVGVFTTGSRMRATILLEKLSQSNTRVTVIPLFEIILQLHKCCCVVAEKGRRLRVLASFKLFAGHHRG